MGKVKTAILGLDELIEILKMRSAFLMQLEKNDPENKTDAP